MLEHLSLFMDFFSCIAQFFEQEHFNQAVLAKEIGNRLEAELGEQIAVGLVLMRRFSEIMRLAISVTAGGETCIRAAISLLLIFSCCVPIS